MNMNGPGSADHPRELISAYLDERLDATERARVADHLRDCDTCRRLLDDFRTLAAAARREETPPVPADLALKIGRRIDAAEAARLARRRRWYTGAPLPLASAAAALLVVASLWIVWRGRLPVEPVPEVTPLVVRMPEPAGAPPPELAQSPAPAPAPSPPPAPTSAPVAETGPGPGATPRPAARSAPSQPPPPSPAPIFRVPADQETKDAAPAREKAMVTDKKAAEGGRQESEADAHRMQAIAPRTSAVAPQGPAAAPAEGLVATGPTLVFNMPEGRVSILPDGRFVLASGGYVCTVDAGGPVEAETVGELRLLASRLHRPAAGSPAAAGPVEAVSGDLVIPPPSGSDPAATDPAARMHRRVRTLVRDHLLDRAEARCGPPPPVLRQIR